MQAPLLCIGGLCIGGLCVAVGTSGLRNGSARGFRNGATVGQTVVWVGPIETQAGRQITNLPISGGHLREGPPLAETGEAARLLLNASTVQIGLQAAQLVDDVIRLAIDWGGIDGFGGLSLREGANRRQKSNAGPAVFQPQFGSSARNDSTTAGHFNRTVRKILPNAYSQPAQALDHDLSILAI